MNLNPSMHYGIANLHDGRAHVDRTVGDTWMRPRGVGDFVSAGLDGILTKLGVSRANVMNQKVSSKYSQFHNKQYIIASIDPIKE